jgi:hypothetical protein
MAKDKQRPPGTPPTWHTAEIAESTADLGLIDEALLPSLHHLASSGHGAAARALQEDLVAAFARLRKKLGVPQPTPPTPPEQPTE